LIGSGRFVIACSRRKRRRCSGSNPSWCVTRCRSARVWLIASPPFRSTRPRRHRPRCIDAEAAQASAWSHAPRIALRRHRLRCGGGSCCLCVVRRGGGGGEGVTRYLERVPSGTVGNLQVAEMGPKSQPDPGGEGDQDNFASGKCRQAKTADEINRSVDAVEAT